MCEDKAMYLRPDEVIFRVPGVSGWQVMLRDDSLNTWLPLGQRRTLVEAYALLVQYRNA